MLARENTLKLPDSARRWRWLLNRISRIITNYLSPITLPTLCSLSKNPNHSCPLILPHFAILHSQRSSSSAPPLEASNWEKHSRESSPSTTTRTTPASMSLLLRSKSKCRRHRPKSSLEAQEATLRHSSLHRSSRPSVSTSAKSSANMSWPVHYPIQYLLPSPTHIQSHRTTPPIRCDAHCGNTTSSWSVSPVLCSRPIQYPLHSRLFHCFEYVLAEPKAYIPFLLHVIFLSIPLVRSLP